MDKSPDPKRSFDELDEVKRRHIYERTAAWFRKRSFGVGGMSARAYVAWAAAKMAEAPTPMWWEPQEEAPSDPVPRPRTRAMTPEQARIARILGYDPAVLEQEKVPAD